MTEPLLFATGLAVALTPPTSVACTGVTLTLAANNRHNFFIVRKLRLYL